MKIEDILKLMEESVKEYGSGPTYNEMPRNTLENKLQAGPTAAHVIEEVHSPLNIAYTTYTTGTSAFQNIVGVTHQELEERIKASKKGLDIAGVNKGDRILISYPPLVNVFSQKALEDYHLKIDFILRPNRDAFILALCKDKPQVVLGESSFIRSAIIDAFNMGLSEAIPKNLKILVAGTPLDMELIQRAERLDNAQIFDFYGAQEFGWLAVNGIPIREDISLIPMKDNPNAVHFVVGGLPTGDVFQTGSNHILAKDKGIVPTYSRVRSGDIWETVILETTVKDRSTASRLATTILRIKGRIVRLSKDIIVGGKSNKLAVISDNGEYAEINEGKTKLFDDLLKAQLDYQGSQKSNPVWQKEEYKP